MIIGSAVFSIGSLIVGLWVLWLSARIIGKARGLSL
jgi:hypothetical protein